MSTTEREVWLASLKHGDKVAVECDYNPTYGYDYIIKTVEQVTPTGYIWLTDGGQYRPDGTTMEKSPWSDYGWGDPLYKLTEISRAVEANIKRSELLSRITTIRWQQLDIEALEEIARVLTKYRGE